MALLKVIEILAESNKGWEDATKNAVMISTAIILHTFREWSNYLFTIRETVGIIPKRYKR